MKNDAQVVERIESRSKKGNYLEVEIKTTYSDGSEHTFYDKYDLKNENLFKKIRLRRFEYEGPRFAVDGCYRYRGYLLSKPSDSLFPTQDANIDINYDKKEIYTEINSVWLSYKLSDEEFFKAINEINRRVCYANGQSNDMCLCGLEREAEKLKLEERKK